jgi:predicted acetyltransferase
MTARIVTPGEEHREQIARVLSTSINFPLAQGLAGAQHFRLDDIRVGIDGDAVVATAGEFRFDQWFGGRGIDCCGITRVATLPEHRSGGLATACTDELLVRARERGTPLAALFPAVLRPYRRMGFELAGSYTTHRVPLDGLSASPERAGAAVVGLADPERDMAGVREAYRDWIQAANGPVEPVDDEHWLVRVFTRASQETYRAVVVREGERITGFAGFTREAEPGHLDVAFGLECEIMFAVTSTGGRALVDYFRGFRGLGVWLEWPGPATDPLAIAIPEALVETRFHYDWMLRLLDVPKALEARGYPPIATDVVIAVEDERWPENAGPWRVESRDGEAHVSPATGEAVRPIPIGTLSAMFSGFLRVPDAVRLGVLDADDPALDGLAAMFSGPDPWCPFFF